ncbi:MAG: phage head-tail connector protein [Pseudomonadota bacterium]
MQFDLAPFALPDGYAEGVVSLEDLKAHLAILGSDEDAYISLCRDAAVDMVEQYCGVYLATRTGVEWRSESLPARPDLGVWPIEEVTGVAWLDSKGSDETGEASDWRVVGKSEITLKPGAETPSDVAAGVVITFSAGFDSANRPPALVRAVKMFAAHLFVHRGDDEAGEISMEVPLGFRRVCAPYRRPRI